MGLCGVTSGKAKSVINGVFNCNQSCYTYGHSEKRRGTVLLSVLQNEHKGVSVL